MERSKFEEGGVEVGQALAERVKPGLQALKGEHRRLVVAPDARRLTGSIDLDAACSEQAPNDPRWDYGIGYRCGSDEHCHWLEVHPAATSDVKRVLEKLAWLERLLDDRASIWLGMTACRPTYTWVATGRVTIRATDRYGRQLASRGLWPIANRLELPRK